MSLIVNNEATPATPSAGTTEVFVNSTKRLSSIDETPTTRVFVDRDSAETLTNKTLTTPVIASSSNIPYVADATGAGSKKVAAGTGTLVTGTVVVATGLATVVGFTATLTAQPTGTGTASNQILAVTSITTGAVTVRAYSVSSVTGATVSGSTSTGSFYWFAMGT